MGRFGRVSYRQMNYRSNYDREYQNDGGTWLPIVLAIGILSPFIAAIILNPYMWIAGIVIWLAYMAVK